MSRLGSIQAERLGVSAIADGVLRLTGGECRAVLAVAGVDFALLSAGEQDAIVAGYAAFLNGLTHPVQELVLVLPVDLEAHLGDVEARAAAERCPGLAELGRDYAAFLRREARRRALLEQRYYVVVPADPPPPPEAPWWWPFGRRRDPAREIASAAPQLAGRCDAVARQLGRCGLGSHRLGDAELVELLHACWCLDPARARRLRGRLAEHTGLVLQAPATDAGRAA